MSIDLLVTGYDDYTDGPTGYQVWPVKTESDQFVVDDQPTTIVHPILYRERLGFAHRLLTSVLQ
jgi:hypothetical protein